MSKQAYINYNPKGKMQGLIEKANEIIAEYEAQGFTLTVRQVYYQFVSRDLVPNSLQSYNLVDRVLNKGRMGGLIDWWAIEDRTRRTYGNSHWDNPKQILDSCARSFRLDTRAGQPITVEVWIEKEALLGVVAPTCQELDVTYLPCKGYYSISAMWRAAQRLKYDNNVVVLHLGDHDPSGLDMTRDIRDRLTLFGCDNLKVKRIALTMAQVEELKPPPNFAKMSDSRYADYAEEYGDQSWELDALKPEYIANLIKKHVDELTDWALVESQKTLQEKYREKLQEVADDSDNWEV